MPGRTGRRLRRLPTLDQPFVRLAHNSVVVTDTGAGFGVSVQSGPPSVGAPDRTRGAEVDRSAESGDGSGSVRVALAEIDDSLRSVSPWWISISPLPDVSSGWAARQPALLAFAMSSLTPIAAANMRATAVLAVTSRLPGPSSNISNGGCRTRVMSRVVGIRSRRTTTRWPGSSARRSRARCGWCARRRVLPVIAPPGRARCRCSPPLARDRRTWSRAVSRCGSRSSSKPGSGCLRSPGGGPPGYGPGRPR